MSSVERSRQDARESKAPGRQVLGGDLRANDLAINGWGSQLAIFVTALLVVESLTGLWIYLTPFSVASQMQVLLHVGAGVILLIPYFYFQVHHFLVWRDQRPTAVMVLGYLLLAMVLICTVSGLVLTWQAARGPKLSPWWDITHLVSGLVSSALIGVHLLLAFLGRRFVAKRIPEFRLALQRFARSGLIWLGVAALPVFAATSLWPSTPVELPLPEGYGLPDYVQDFDEYRGNPFAPTYARTSGGKLINPDVLSGSESCGTAGCHQQILEEWQPSAHRFSAMNPPFQQVQKNFASDREPAETRYCAGCHDPISLFAGAKDIQNLDLAAPGMQEGCSCVVCHSISEVDQRGNADYVVTPPMKYVWESSVGWKKFVSDFLIRAYPRQHLADYDRNLLRTPEFCGACHKQFIPEALNRFGLSPGQNQYDEWRKSHWHVDDADKDLSCRDCHMRLVYNSTDPGRGEAGAIRRTANDGAHRHHGMVATNMFIPAAMKLQNWEQHVKLTEEWIRGETVIEEIAHLWPTGPVASIQIVAPQETHPGERLTLRAVVMNRKAGHYFTTGPLDFMRAWVHLRVLDAEGNKIAEWGAIDPHTRAITDLPGQAHEIGNSRKEGTLVLEGQPMDGQGNPLVRHELWNKAGGKGVRVIFPSYSDSQTYQFKVPPSVTGELTVKAELNFRRYRQEFLDLVVPTMETESGVLQPTVAKSFDEERISIVGENVAKTAAPLRQGPDE